MVGELFELHISDVDEVWALISELLEEIKHSDYAGAHPPLKSIEPEIADCELYAFAWQSIRLQKKMYLKFAINRKGRFFYVSLHKSRPPGKNR